MPESRAVLFVCLGNICRSPTAEGVFRHYAQGCPSLNLAVDSAGTAAYHTGKAPDSRARQAAARRGYDLSALRARQVVTEDYHRFDYLLAMDRQNLDDLLRRRPPGARADVRLLLDFAEGVSLREVPDPYYGGEQGFEQVLDLVEAASAGLLSHLLEQAGRGNNPGALR